MLLTDDRVSVFFDGTLGDPQLDHPEGIAVDADGAIWCGGERGQIFRIDPDGTSIEEVASTGGFALGLAFDRAGDLFVCDLKHAAVFRMESSTGRIERFSDGAPGRPFRIPNSPAFDEAGHLYVSDSHAFGVPGPGVFRVDAEGKGELWYDRLVTFANGLAVAPGGAAVYVAETFASTVFRIPIHEDGSAGEREDVASTPGSLPDGLAFDVDGNLYVGCYEPSQILRIDPSGVVDVLWHDVTAHTLAHPTNVAFRGTMMFTANLGRWHVTRIEVGAEGVRLPVGGPP
ncbi:MAG TPA: SMP-30/gluconolactonase/LRE family protein [Actinomycetota bacterium]|nr:SMP-30/gluconolactonase/LRE family protein [Actinomycetota bacterium]